MKSLEEKILKTSLHTEGDTLDVDRFLNRMADPALLEELAADFAECFAGEQITRVLTVESAGIAIATMTGYKLSAKSVYAVKSKNKVEPDAYVAPVSGKNGLSLSLPKKFLSKSDHVLIVDDFLGTGAATNALVEIVRQSGAQLSGVAVAIERKYLGGGDALRQRGIHLRCAVSILSKNKENGIVFEKQEKNKTE